MKRIIRILSIIMLGTIISISIIYLSIWATGVYHDLQYRYAIYKKKQNPAVTYYLSPGGNNANSGRSRSDAWKTIGQLNKVEFNPGDKVLFEGGQTFSGTLVLDSHDLGAPDKPILISSYGSGVATIEAGKVDGISTNNTAGLSISRLKITGSGEASNTGIGIRITNDLWGNVTLPYLRISQVDVSGFGIYGIGIQGRKWKSGFKDCQVAYSSLHDNAEAGLYIEGIFEFLSSSYAHEQVVIHHVMAYNNHGKNGPELPNTGSGIVLSDVDNGLIERCVAHHNGERSNSQQGGPVGIWAWDSNNITIQHNVSYQNKTGGKKDGGGFDLDGGITNSVMQYNYSHDNDGSGYLFAQFPYARESENNIIRYNISQNDGRKNNTAGIYFWGEFRDSYIYNNTVYIAESATSRPSAIKVEHNHLAPSYQSQLPSNAKFFNNILVCTSGLPLINQPYDIRDFIFRNNNYYSPDSAITFIWKNKVYRTLTEWRNATKQEMDKTAIYGFNENPQLVGLGKGPIINNADSLNKLYCYDLLPTSPMIDRGLNIDVFLNSHTQSIDFHRKAVPNKLKLDLGAVEFTRYIQSI